MRRIQILGIVLTLFLVLVSATSTPALAKRDNNLYGVHYGSIGTTTLINLPDHGPMTIEAMNIERSPFGPYDFLGLMMMPDIMVMITDNDDFADFIDDVMFGGFPVTIRVQDNELEVWRKGKNLFAELKYSLSPIGNLSIVFEGFGGAKHGTETEEIPGTDLVMTAKFMGFNAFITILAHVGTPAQCELITLGLVGTHVRWTITET